MATNNIEYAQSKLYQEMVLFYLWPEALLLFCSIIIYSRRQDRPHRQDQGLCSFFH